MLLPFLLGNVFTFSHVFPCYVVVSILEVGTTHCPYHAAFCSSLVAEAWIENHP